MNAFVIIKVPSEQHTIQSAIDAAGTGDTIIVSPGTYMENLSLAKPLHLWSESGPQLTIIHDAQASSAWVNADKRVISVTVSGAGEIKGFTIVGNKESNGAGIFIGADGWRIQDCSISDNHFGIQAYDGSVRIEGNRISGNTILGIGAGRHTQIINNFVVGNEDGITAFDSTIVLNNLIADCIEGVDCGSPDDTPTVCNNVITTFSRAGGGSQQTGVRFNGNDCPGIVKNNIVAESGRDGIFSSFGYINRIPKYQIRYNDVFENHPNYSDLVGDRTNQDGNIGGNPLFCDNDSLFFLASDSPCIDQGDPAMTDLDGSRSDIGMYGGKGAKEQRYAPASFELELPKDSASVNLTSVTLRWIASYDRDYQDQITYRVILGKALEFFYTARGERQSRVSAIVDTIFTSSTQTVINGLKESTAYYWMVEAIDNTGLFKRSNTYHSFTTTRNLSGSSPADHTPSDYNLEQNYPNPFNPSTTIGFNLPSRTYVSLKIFDALGREISALISEELTTGTYSRQWNAAGCPSGVYFYRLQAGSYVETKRLVILK